VVRGDTRLRYRQWMTHKLDTWFEQFGRGGCVGCGRCVAWCPAGIDLTAEAEWLLNPASPDRVKVVRDAGS
jgi:ferredoxin